MTIFSPLSFILLIVIVSLVQRNGVAGNPDIRSSSSSGSGKSAHIMWERNNEITESPIEASICPDDSTISPCTCTKDSWGIQIWCDGSAVDQTSVENSLSELRRVNQIPADRGIHMSVFRLWSTELTQFDLAPLYKSRIDSFEIQFNYNLTKWVTSGLPQDHGSIHVDTFWLIDAHLNGDEFGDTFKYFSVEMTGFSAYRLTINPNNNNNDDEGESEFEFLPGLSAFVNLEYLRMVDCNISGRLNSSSFKDFPRLQRIYLESNKIDGIGENVFHSNVSYIDLSENSLNETSFHPKSGIAHNQTGSRKTLDLQSNQITTLPSEIFQTFLDAHPQNYLSLRDNPLICDEQLSWIKSRQEEFQLRVDGADCSNDPGHTVFDSNLIP